MEESPFYANLSMGFFKELKVLNLGHMDLFVRLPITVESLAAHCKFAKDITYAVVYIYIFCFRFSSIYFVLNKILINLFICD